jgi:MYXO-CTERM domain-containing protein
MVAAVIPILLAGNQAYAAIDLSDWKTPGDNLLVTDTVTGLQWLNLRQTAGMSYNDVTSDLSNTFSGFTLASAFQVATFFADAAIEIDTSFPGDYPPIVNLLEQWGITGVGLGPNYFSWFMTTTFAPYYCRGVIWYSDWSCFASPWYSAAFSINPAVGQSFIAFALYRPEPTGVVPEPTTLLVWSGLGAMGLVAAWRRRRRAA